MCSGGCGGGAQKALDAQRAAEVVETVYVNHYPDGRWEETTGEANARARQRTYGGTYRVKG
jgi:hypothetical protein